MKVTLKTLAPQISAGVDGGAELKVTCTQTPIGASRISTFNIKLHKFMSARDGYEFFCKRLLSQPKATSTSTQLNLGVT